MDKENKLILYKDEEGKVNVNVRFADEDVWLTQAQLAEIYNTTQQNISLHQKGIYADGELDEEATHKKYLLVRQEGKRQVQREIDFDKAVKRLRNRQKGETKQRYEDSHREISK